MPDNPKKMLILDALEVLRRHTDEDHRLTQKAIIDLMAAEHGMTCDRKTMKRTLEELRDAGYPVEYRDGWYYEHDFTTGELNLLVDSLLFNPAVGPRYRRDLVDKLRALASEHYQPVTGESLGQHPNPLRPSNPEFLLTLDALHDAIQSRRRASFHYNYHDVDKRLHPRLDGEGQPLTYVVSPYRVLQNSGRYYLVCAREGERCLRHFRIDRITACRTLSEPSAPMREIEGGAALQDPARYIAEHPHMFGGPVREVRLRVLRRSIGEVLDWFGTGVRFARVTEETADAIVRTDEMSLKYWLLQYGEVARLAEDDGAPGASSTPADTHRTEQ